MAFRNRVSADMGGRAAWGGGEEEAGGEAAGAGTVETTFLMSTICCCSLERREFISSTASRSDCTCPARVSTRVPIGATELEICLSWPWTVRSSAERLLVSRADASRLWLSSCCMTPSCTPRFFSSLLTWSCSWAISRWICRISLATGKAGEAARRKTKIHRWSKRNLPSPAAGTSPLGRKKNQLDVGRPLRPRRPLGRLRRGPPHEFTTCYWAAEKCTRRFRCQQLSLLSVHCGRSLP